MTAIEECSRAFLSRHPISRRGESCWCHLPDDDPIHQPERIDADGYHVFWSSGIESLRHLNGVDWTDAAVPPRRHWCWPQTKGYFRDSGPVWRCGCGAICRGEGHWWERNSRRAEDPERGFWSWLRRRP